MAIHPSNSAATRVSIRFPIASFAALSAGMIATAASAGVVTATFQVGNGPPMSLSIAGTPGLFGGEQFQHTLNVDGVAVTWTYTVKIDAVQNRILSGNTTVINGTTALVTVESVLSTALAQPLVDNVLTGGTVSAKLVSNADGGALLCGSGSALVMPVSDGEPVGSFFNCPFQMAFSGASTGSTSAQWGLPIPSAVGPKEVGTLGHRISIGLTPGDKAILNMLFAAKGDVAATPPVVSPPDENDR